MCFVPLANYILYGSFAKDKSLYKERVDGYKKICVGV